MEYPDVVVGIDGNAANLTADPLVWQGLGPERIGFEERHLLAIPLRAFGRR
jgi:hypothetical protein